LVGIQISTTIMESSVKIPQKAKDRTALWCSDTISGYSTQRNVSQNTIETPVHWGSSQHYSQ
jgi:hypothetical protein